MTLELGERVDEAEVIAEFLRAEVDSPRFGPRIRARLDADGRDPRVLTRPDPRDRDENAYRRALLHAYRGTGGSAPLLEGLPEEMDWHRAVIGREEIGLLHYIDYPYWNELSAGTRSPVVAADRIRAGMRAQDRPNDAFLALAERLCAGADVGMPIAVAADHASPLIVLEGHTRVTAMALRADCLPARLPVYVGFAPGVRDWMFHGRFEDAR